MGEVTRLLKQIGEGDSQARDQLFSLLYRDLRRLAHARMRRSETITLLDTTALVHEAYLRLLSVNELTFADRGRFFAFAASLMRAIIVDAVRARAADRRGGNATHVPLDSQVVDLAWQEEGQVVAVHEALEELAKLDERLAKVVEMRYFAGLTESEIADVLGITERTVRRDWEKARTLLFAALK